MNTRYVSFVGFLVLPSNNDQLEKKYPNNTYSYEESYWEVTGEEYDEEREEWYDTEEEFTRIITGEEEFKNLEYSIIDSQDSLTVYLSIIDEKTGHLVADCPAGGWSTGTFVVLENGTPKKSENNYNPNPVRQLV